MDASEFCAMVDHTLLKPEATAADIEVLCREARSLQVAAVCVNGLWVADVARWLAGSDIAACSVVGFPLGAMATPVVVTEITQALADGADEIDAVVPIGFVKARDGGRLAEHLGSLRAAAGDTTLKIILETALLTDEEIDYAARAGRSAGVDFVKTSTGFNDAGGATVEAVALLRRAVGDDVGVKASGGIRTLADVEAMVSAGADRLGMSATLAVVHELVGD